MRFLLDTNVLSELRRPKPDRKLTSWLLQNEAACGISDIVIGEFNKGANFLPEGERRQSVLSWIEEVEAQFEDKILPVDRNVWKYWGELCGNSEREHGRRFQVIDSLIAATALAHRLVLVTRNVNDFPSAVATHCPWGD